MWPSAPGSAGSHPNGVRPLGCVRHLLYLTLITCFAFWLAYWNADPVGAWDLMTRAVQAWR